MSKKAESDSVQALPNERIEAIRDLVTNNQGKVLRMEDFNSASGITTAFYYVDKLIKEGYLQRHKVNTGKRGHFYTYTWNNEPTPPKIPVDIDEINVFYNEWREKVTSDDDQSLAMKQLGASEFIKFIKQKQNAGDQK